MFNAVPQVMLGIALISLLTLRVIMLNLVEQKVFILLVIILRVMALQQWVGEITLRYIAMDRRGCPELGRISIWQQSQNPSQQKEKKTETFKNPYICDFLCGRFKWWNFLSICRFLQKGVHLSKKRLKLMFIIF